MKKKYLVVQVLEISDLQISKIRKVLQEQVYFEVDKTFYISSSKRFKNRFKNYLLDKKVNFIFTFVNIKTGGDFETYGVAENIKNGIKNIILPK